MKFLITMPFSRDKSVIRDKLKHFPSDAIIWLKQTTVEPIGFLNFLAFHIFLLTLQTGLYDVICYQEYNDDRSVDCSDLKASTHAEDHVQQKASLWNIVFSMAHCLPAIVAHVLLGSWSDKSGRKINILIGLVGLLLNVFPLTVIFLQKNTSLWFLGLSSFISGATGYIGIVITSSFAYLSDIVENKDHLAVRMMNYSLAMSFAGIIGPLVAGALLRRKEFAYIIVIIEIVLTVAFFYTLVRLKQVSPEQIKRRRQFDNEKITSAIDRSFTNSSLDSSIVVNRVNQSVTFNPRKRTLATTLKDAKRLLLDVLKTYSKPRAGKRKAYLLLCSLTYFLSIFAEMGLRGNVTSLYVFRRPLEWSGSKLAYWKMVHNLLLFFGTLLGSLLFKKILKFHETTIMLISLASGCLELLITGFASNTWLMYLAVHCGTFSYLFVPSCKAFTSRLVDPDEVGKSYTAYGLAADLGYGISNMMANAIYFGTLKRFAGFVFVLGACFYAVSFCIIFWIHFDSVVLKRTMILNNADGGVGVEVEETTSNSVSTKTETEDLHF